MLKLNNYNIVKNANGVPCKWVRRLFLLIFVALVLYFKLLFLQVIDNDSTNTNYNYQCRARDNMYNRYLVIGVY